MKYKWEITIDLPRQRVIELFDDPDNLPKWQPGLERFELLSGDAGQPRARSRLLYNQSGRRIEMIETVTRRSLPEEFSGTYEARGVKNWIATGFTKQGQKNPLGLGE